MVDSADTRRLELCRQELFNILGQEKLAGATLLIFANKQDLAGAQTTEEIAASLDLGADIFEKRHWKIQACSAVTGEGLVEGMSWLTDDISSRIYV